jgi:hypothetical protein
VGDAAGWTETGTAIVDRLTNTQPAPPPWLILAAGVLALAIVACRPVWRVARNVVTITHEGGHALVALLAGRSVDNIKLHSDTSGVTVSRGKPYGLGMVLTTLAGYPAPSLLGLGFAALLGTQRITLMLWVAIVLLAGLLLKIRNVYGVFSVCGTGALIFALSWFGSAALQGACAYFGTWFLLIGGVRPVLELRRSRKREPGSDADQLARLTHVPGLIWVLLFGGVGLAALAVGGEMMVTAPAGWNRASLGV